MKTDMGKVLLIANPAAQNGKGIDAAALAEVLLEEALGEEQFSLALTTRPNHAADIAAQAEGFDTVVALGGDGVIHEVANGLMHHPANARPTLGIIPVGSGNDYAKALGMPKGVDAACQALLTCAPRSVDVGKVNDSYFVETLSFGLDAAIALDTVDRRVRTGRKGAALYMASGFDQLAHHFDVFSYEATFDGAEPIRSSSITFAVQIGPFYGGGFNVCPNAKMDDGEFDICISHPPVSVPHAAFIFLLAKSGKHTKAKPIEMLRADHVHVTFDAAPPAQMDGERIEGTSFDISLEQGALNVLAPTQKK